MVDEGCGLRREIILEELLGEGSVLHFQAEERKGCGGEERRLDQFGNWTSCKTILVQLFEARGERSVGG